MKRLATVMAAAAVLLVSVIAPVKTSAQDGRKENKGIKDWHACNPGRTQWTTEEKLYALSAAWMEVKRSCAFMKNIGEERWDSIYRSLIMPATETDDDGFSLLMARFMASLKDGHTGLTYNRRNKYYGTTNYFDDRWYFTLSYCDGQVMAVSVAKDKEKIVPLGSTVVSVDGRPIGEVMDEMMEEMSASTDYGRASAAAGRPLSGAVGTRRTVTFRRPDGREVTLELTNKYVGNVDAVHFTRFAPTDKQFCLEWPADDIALITVNTFGDSKVVDEFDKVFPEIQRRARKVIIDISRNGGGNTSNAAGIISHFIEGNRISSGRWTTPSYKAAYASWGRYINPQDTAGNSWKRECYLNYTHRNVYDGGHMVHEYSDDYPRHIVPTVILTSVNTASAAEDMLMMTDGQKHIVRMGLPTNGSTGNPLMVDLLPDLGIRVCTLEETYPDGRPFVGIGIKPDIEVSDTYENLKQVDDYLVKAALKYLKKK